MANSADRSGALHRSEEISTGERVVGSSGLTPVLERNIQTLCRRRAAEAAAASWQDRIAAAVTRFTTSMLFVYLHLAFFGYWIIRNYAARFPAFGPGTKRLWFGHDRVGRGDLLSTFALITQNRMAAAADKRADLDLQISLLAEYEVSKLAVLTSAIAKHLGVKSNVERDVVDAKQEVAPDKLLDKIEIANTLSRQLCWRLMSADNSDNQQRN